MEARDRVGGRVHSYLGSGFSGPIDLGASLITGTATDVAKGLRPDPSAVAARCASRMLCCDAQACSSRLLLNPHMHAPHVHTLQACVTNAA